MRRRPARPSGGSARAAERALDILLAFLREPGPLGISELSRRVRLPKATVHRLVAVLASRGFLAREPGATRYRVGLAAFQLGTRFLEQTQVRTVALPVIRELAAATGETVNLNVVIDGRRVCVEKTESTHDIRHAVELGRPLPLVAGASGKVLLAHLPEDEIAAITRNGLHRLAARTPVDRRQLLRQLAEIRRRGVAVSSDERVDGASSVSAPIRDSLGRVVAGLTISGPTYRFTPERVRDFIARVRDGAARISLALGYDGPPSGEDGRARRVAAGRPARSAPPSSRRGRETPPEPSDSSRPDRGAIRRAPLSPGSRSRMHTGRNTGGEGRVPTRRAHAAGATSRREP